MIEGQKTRFLQKNVQQLIENYIRDPVKYEQEYLALIKDETITQYQDYFQTDKE
jgi:hypothetical protein